MEVYEGIDGIKHALTRKKNRFYMIMYRGAGEGHECCAQTSESGVHALEASRRMREAEPAHVRPPAFLG